MAPDRSADDDPASAVIARSTSSAPAWPERFEPAAPPRDWDSIVMHHSATDEGSVASIDREHRARRDERGRPWAGIGYHFVIGNGRGMPDGFVEPTFRWIEQLHGAHAGSRMHNERGIGICLIGDCQRQRPSDRQVEAARRLVALLRQRYPIAREQVLGHSSIKATSCPGRFFPLREITGDDARLPWDDAASTARESRPLRAAPAIFPRIMSPP